MVDARFQLDDIDFKILRFLVADARVPFSSISKAVRLSDVAVKRRVERLMKKGILNGFSARINLDALGFSHPVFIGIRTELPKTNHVVKELARNDSVSEIYQTLGDYNLRIAVLTPSLDQTRSFVESLSRIDGVLDVKSTLVLNSLKDDKYSSLFSLTKALPFEE